MAGEGQAAFFAIHAEDGDVVAALVARVKELAGGVEVETSRVVPARPSLAHESQPAVVADGEDPNAVVQAVAGIDEPAISGDQDLRAEIAAGESVRQGGDRLPRGEPSFRGIVIEQNNVRAFLLNGIEPASIGLEVKMPRPVSRWQRNGGRIVRTEQARLLVKLPDKDLIQAQIDVQHEASRGIGLDHVGVRAVVAADGEASGRS